ncbi:hypothetical protein H6F88_01970 [Oculatella sp. FACHB-28]|uniref:hypothetical protein n=1 Tax=Oculatella sp. FACHB-28 TaxID=2692845 RepID=UPI001689E432|nr:hypothetical protein [Oculatella sp. FACHB-28]MBD2054801.1 hypothetical protein [Oculatella sp. FACHB-28]
MKKPTIGHFKMLQILESGSWVSNDQLANGAGVSLLVAQRFTRFLSREGCLERIDAHPKPLFSMTQSKPSEDCARFLELAKQLGKTIPAT